MGQLASGLSSPLGGFLMNWIFAGQQRKLNEQVRAQQEQQVGETRGYFGLGDLPGIPTVAPPPGMDISQFPGQAQTLADRMARQSRGYQRIGLRELARLGPHGRMSQQLEAMPRQFGRANQRILEQFGGQAGDITSQFQRGAGGILGQFGQGAEALRGQYGAGAGGLLSQFGQGAEALRGQFGAGAAGITGGYGARLGTAMGMLEGRGAQAEEDISTRFQESLANQQQALRARGFGGTMAANIAQGSAREESAEQRRLQEQLRGERLGVFGQMSGQGLAAQERMLGAGTGLGQQLLGAETGLGQQLLGTGTALGQQLLGSGTALGQQLLGTGTGLQAGFAGQQLAAGQGGQQFLGGLGLSALGQRGQMGQFFQQQHDLLRQQNLANQFGFGQYPIGVGQQVTGMALNTLGPIDIRPPQQLQFPQILPPVR